MKRYFVGLAVIAALLGPASLNCLADAVSLGAAANFAVLDVGGTVSITSNFKVYQSATVINGNVGEGPNTLWGHGIDATIHGTIFYDTSDTLPAITGTISGGETQQVMTPIVTAAISASAAAAALTPTQTFSTLTSGQVIVGNGGLNVIRVTGDVGISGGSTTLTLQGGASDKFVFQFTANDATSAHELVLSGVTMNITGVSASNIVWDLNGGGGNVQITSGATVDGIFLAPYRSVTVDHGNITGAVIAGGSPNPSDNSANLLSIHSGSEITVPTPTTPVPEPATLVLLGTGLLGFAGVIRRKLA